jgi:hypothetical protein
MRRPRRNHSAAYKAKVALAALMGDKILAPLCEKLTCSPARSCSGRRNCSTRRGFIYLVACIDWAPTNLRGGAEGDLRS